MKGLGERLKKYVANARLYIVLSRIPSYRLFLFFF